MVKKHQVAPTYNMAAFAVKPLSFNTLKDNQSLKNLGLALDKYMLPTLSDKLGKFMNALDFQIKNENGKQIKMYSMVSGKNVYAYQNGKNVVIVNIGTGDSFTLENTQISKDLSGFNYDHNIYEFYQDWYQASDGNYYPTYGLKPKNDLVTENYERVYVLETTPTLLQSGTMQSLQ